MIEIYFVYVRILNEDKVKILYVNENYGYILWKLIGCWYKIKKNKDLFCYKVYDKKKFKNCWCIILYWNFEFYKK